MLAYKKAKAAIEEAGGVMRCPNFDYGENPESTLMETLLMATHELASSWALDEDEAEDTDSDFPAGDPSPKAPSF